MYVQDMFERALMEEIAGEQIVAPGVYLQQMPSPCYSNSRFVLYMLPLAMLFAWLLPVAMTTKVVVREKERRVKEFVKMMGVSEGLLRLSWFLHSLVVSLVTMAIITLLLKVFKLLPKTDWLILFLFLTLYAVVMLSYSFLVSAFFNNANLAASVSALIYFLVLFVQFSVVQNLYSINPYITGLCVSENSGIQALCLGDK